jgi:hypothetical protein
MSVVYTLKIVVVRILCQPSIHESPSKVIHSILLVFYDTKNHLSIHMIMQEMVKMALNREGLKKELLVVLFARCMAKYDTFPLLDQLGSSNHVLAR